MEANNQCYLKAAPAQAAQPVPQAVSQQPSAAAAAAMPKASESFGNFADFDSAAFDSMPAGDILKSITVQILLDKC